MLHLSSVSAITSAVLRNLPLLPLQRLNLSAGVVNKVLQQTTSHHHQTTVIIIIIIIIIIETFVMRQFQLKNEHKRYMLW